MITTISMACQRLQRADRCTPVFHGFLLLIHDLISTRNGHLWWDNQNNDPRAELGSLLHKRVGQPVVFAKGRVQPNNQIVTSRQVICSNACRCRCNPHDSYSEPNTWELITLTSKGTIEKPTEGNSWCIAYASLPIQLQAASHAPC